MHYIRHFIGAVIAIALLFTGFNILINPYDYWDVDRFEGINKYKPSFERHQNISKFKQYNRVKPQTVILGNSRVQIGFDPQSSTWNETAQPIYNMGLPGIGLPGLFHVLRRSAEESEHAHRPAHIYIGVDFMDFRVSQENWSRFQRTKNKNQEDLPHFVKITLSLDALKDSILTLIEQYKAHPHTVDPYGFNPMFDYRGHVQDIGYEGLFEQKDQFYQDSLTNGAKHVWWDHPGYSASWAALDDILNWAEMNDVKITLFTYPYHSSLLQYFVDFGLWPAFEEWKLKLTEKAQEANAPLWDFALYTSDTGERIPPHNSMNNHMQWYWEAAHFKASMGERMIKQMQEGDRGSFGRRLMTETLASHLDQQRVAAQKYQSAQREDTRSNTGVLN